MNTNEKQIEEKIQEKIDASECIPIKKSMNEKKHKQLKQKIINEIESLEENKKFYPPQNDFIQPTLEVSSIFQETFESIFQSDFVERFTIFQHLKNCENKIRSLFFLTHNYENYIDYVVKNYGQTLENLIDMLGTIPNPLIHEILNSPVLTLEEKRAKLKFVRI